VYKLKQMSELRLVQYSEKSVALLGDSKHLYDQLMSLKIGVWNKHLTFEGEKCYGWVFANKHEATIKSLIQGTAVATKKETLNKKYSIAELEKYLMANLDKLAQIFGQEMKIASCVMNDTNMLPDDGKRYLFLGAGCGFSWLRCDRRNKLATEIIKDSELLKSKIDAAFIKTIDKAYLQKLENSGNPIQAHLSQNLSYKSRYNGIVREFMKNYLDIDKAKVTIKNFDD